MAALAVAAAIGGAAVAAGTRSDAPSDAGPPFLIAAAPALTLPPVGVLPPPAPPTPVAAPGSCRAAGSVASRNHGSRSRRLVALTFDDGPWPSTRAVLRVLRRTNVRATFFVLGSLIRDRPRTVAQIRAAGHALGNHTWGHPDLTALSGRAVADQLDGTDAAIRRSGPGPCLFRAPYGLTDRRVLRMVRNRGMVTVGWDVDSRDYTRPGARQIVRTVLGSVRPGSIVLMHDGGGDRVQTVAALPKIIRVLRRRNYRLVTVPDLLRLRRQAPKAGR